MTNWCRRDDGLPKICRERFKIEFSPLLILAYFGKSSCYTTWTTPYHSHFGFQIFIDCLNLFGLVWLVLNLCVQFLLTSIPNLCWSWLVFQCIPYYSIPFPIMLCTESSAMPPWISHRWSNRLLRWWNAWPPVSSNMAAKIIDFLGSSSQMWPTMPKLAWCRIFTDHHANLQCLANVRYGFQA